MQIYAEEAEARLEASTRWEDAAIRGLKAVAAEAVDTGRTVEDAVTGAFRGLEDVIVDFVTTASWRSRTWPTISSPNSRGPRSSRRSPARSRPCSPASWRPVRRRRLRLFRDRGRFQRRRLPRRRHRRRRRPCKGGSAGDIRRCAALSPRRPRRRRGADHPAPRRGRLHAGTDAGAGSPAHRDQFRKPRHAAARGRPPGRDQIRRPWSSRSSPTTSSAVARRHRRSSAPMACHGWWDDRAVALLGCGRGRARPGPRQRRRAHDARGRHGAPGAALHQRAPHPRPGGPARRRRRARPLGDLVDDCAISGSPGPAAHGRRQPGPGARRRRRHRNRLPRLRRPAPLEARLTIEGTQL